MNNPFIIAIIGILGSIITALTGFHFGKQKVILEYRKSLSIEVWKERNTYYRKLIKFMNILSFHSTRIGEVKYKELYDCFIQSKDWYYDGGGLFLTKRSRDSFFEIQKHLDINIFNPKFFKEKSNIDKIISENDYVTTREKMSSLRTELTNDLLSRERGFHVTKL